MTTVTIKLGGFSRAVTKAKPSQRAVLAECLEVARDNNLIVVVKRDHAGRWQGWAKRRNPLGARAVDSDYRYLPQGRLAVRTDLTEAGGCVYVADTAAGCGAVEATRIL